MTRGRRESQWLVLGRCLAIIQRVQRGPADWEQLVQAVLRMEGPDAYGGAKGETLRKRFENDLHRIRESLQVDLFYDRQSAGYIIRDLWRPLLDLTDEDIGTLAWLQRTFTDGAPNFAEVQSLVEHLRFLLAPERRAPLMGHHTSLGVDLTPCDTDRIDPTLFDTVARSVVLHRRLEILYQAPHHTDGLHHHYLIDPYRLYFDTRHGHYYLWAWCHTVHRGEERQLVAAYRQFRVGRIHRVDLMPDKIPLSPPPAPQHPVVYQLTPEIARGGINRHPPIQIEAIEPQEDGGAVVRGVTDSTFWTLQYLLPYGAHCRILGGSQLLAEVKEIVGNMSRLYEASGNDPTLVGE